MEITIKPAKEQDLKILNKYLPSKILSYHQDKITSQKKGEILWLIIYKEDVPIGHAELIWAGNPREDVKLYVKNTPQIDSLYIKPEYRNKGLGTKFIQSIEEIVKERGYPQIGMSVDVKNLKAIALYKKLGYKIWEHGDYDASWVYTDQNRDNHQELETCTQMIKEF